MSAADPNPLDQWSKPSPTAANDCTIQYYLICVKHTNQYPHLGVARHRLLRI